MADRILERLRAIVRALPETGEKTPWGPDPHWTVRDKIFAGYGGGSIGVRVDKELQAALVASDPRFTIAAYVGKHGWVDLQLGPTPDWGEVEALMLGSYQMIAPKRLAAQVGAGGEAARRAKPPAKQPPAKKAPAKQPPAKKSSAKKPPAKASPVKKSPAKKSPAKPPPAKKSPAKKSPAKKSPAK